MEKGAPSENPLYDPNPATNILVRLENSPTDFRLCLREHFTSADDILEDELVTRGWFLMLMTHCPPFVHMEMKEQRKLVRTLFREKLGTRLAQSLAAVYDSPAGSESYFIGWLFELAKAPETGPAKDPIENVDINFAKMLL
ncbi:hypothetical protein C8J56DRAFT_1042912 [Mycena floridula]|nr:hypothetical protein C8J56DRAFT_1042912 [Mycena floridula]